MSDKDVERNVRSTTVEGIKTPTEQHIHGLGEKHAISYGEKAEASKTKENLFDKFRRREERRAGFERKGESENSEPAESAGDGNPSE